MVNKQFFFNDGKFMENSKRESKASITQKDREQYGKKDNEIIRGVKKMPEAGFEPATFRL